MERDSVAETLLRGLDTAEREQVVKLLAQAVHDERAAAEAGRPTQFPTPAPRSASSPSQPMQL